MRRLKVLEWLVLLTIAIGAGPASSAIWQWSTTAATNATADPSINWAEGMSPSSVNDSARAMMSAIAAWRNDISAVNTTGGTTTAYTLTTSEGVSSPPSNGQMIAFIVNATNGASPTLAVDGGTAYPIWLNGAVTAAGALVAGSPYRVAFSLSNGAWMLEAGPANPFNTPLGGLIWTTISTAPNSSFLSANGQCVSTTTYATYWAAIGSPVPGACSAGNFALIDLRGRAVAGLDTLPGASAASRMTSAATGCGVSFTTMGAVCTESQSTTLVTANLPAYTPAGSISNGAISISHNAAAQNGSTTGGGGFLAGGSAATISASQAASGFFGSPQGGSSTAFSKVQPTMGLYPWVRVL
jgi:hypothetical protein